MQRIVDCLVALKPVMQRILTVEPCYVRAPDRLRLLDIPLLSALGWKTDDPDAVRLLWSRGRGPLTKNPWFGHFAPTVDLYASVSGLAGEVRAAFVLKSYPFEPTPKPDKPYLDALFEELIMSGFTAVIVIDELVYTVYPLDQDYGVQKFVDIDLAGDPVVAASQLTSIAPNAIMGGSLMDASRALRKHVALQEALRGHLAHPSVHKALSKATTLAPATVREILATAVAHLEFPRVFPIAGNEEVALAPEPESFTLGEGDDLSTSSLDFDLLNFAPRAIAPQPIFGNGLGAEDEFEI